MMPWDISEPENMYLLQISFILCISNAGCCWAFSACGAIEGINALVTGELISLSTQELVNCDTSNKGCEGGLMDPAFKFVINNRGIDSAADYPYTKSRGSCSYNKACDGCNFP